MNFGDHGEGEDVLWLMWLLSGFLRTDWPPFLYSLQSIKWNFLFSILLIPPLLISISIICFTEALLLE